MNENIKNTLVASTSLIPIAGGALSVLLDKYIPSIYEKKREAFFLFLDQEFKKLNIDEKQENLNSEAFMMVFVKVFKGVMEEYHEEKIKAFQNILINSLMNKTEDKFDEVSFFIRLVNDLTVDQIKIMLLVKNKQFVQEDSLYKAVNKLWGDIEESYLMACVTELIRANLISNSSKNQTQTNFKHYLTAFGEKFLNYISDYKHKDN